MNLADIVNLHYHVKDGQAYNGPYTILPTSKCVHIDPLLANARNLLVCLDTAQYTVYRLTSIIEDNHVDEPALITQAKSLIDIMRLSIAAATGEELPELLFPQEYSKCGYKPVVLSEPTPYVSTPAIDTIERLRRKYNKSEPQHKDNIIPVDPSRWTAKLRNEPQPPAIA